MQRPSLQCAGEESNHLNPSVLPAVAFWKTLEELIVDARKDTEDIRRCYLANYLIRCLFRQVLLGAASIAFIMES